MKTVLTLLLVCVPLLRAQELPPLALPSSSATLVRQFQGYEDKTRLDAERSIDAARDKLIALLMAEANKATPGDALQIRGYIDTLKHDAREAAAPSCFDYWFQNRLVVGYFNNGKTATVTVGTVAKKRTLLIHGNQDKASTVGEIFLVRGERETKVGDWKKGQANPLSFDVTGVVTKPGDYTFRFRYRDGGDEYTVEKVGIQVTK